jgi:anti-sigma factor ChrR (cupin superfamily)
MLRCKQVIKMVASDDLVDEGPWLRLKIRLHLMMCRHCARYAAQIRAIGAKTRERFHPSEQRSAVEDVQQRIIDSANKLRNDGDPS